MLIKRTEGNKMHVETSSDEVCCLANVLNEVLHGFLVQDFEQRLEGSRDQVNRLWCTFNALDNASENRGSALAIDDVLVLRNAARVCIEELGEEEFSTRVGCDINSVLKLIGDLDQAISTV